MHQTIDPTHLAIFALLTREKPNISFKKKNTTKTVHLHSTERKKLLITSTTWVKNKKRSKVQQTSILPIWLVFMFYSDILPFLLEWNSYSHIPKPLNLVPNLPGWPSLHVPSISNISSLTMSAQGHTHRVRGSQRGERGCFCAALHYFSIRERKSRGFGRPSILVFQVASLIVARSFPYTLTVFILPKYM